MGWFASERGTEAASVAQAASSAAAQRHFHDQRREARAAKDFPRSDAIRDELAALGVEVMDGDPLGWDWKVTA